MMRESKIHMFCIGHTKLSLVVPDTAYLIRTSKGFLSDNAHLNLISLEDVSQELDYYYPYLGGIAGVFAVHEIIKKKLVQVGSDDRVMLFQQAKYVSPNFLTRLSTTYKTSGLLYESEAVNIDFTQMFSKYKENYLISWPSYLHGKNGFPTISEHYAMAHSLSDFLNFFSVAIDRGAISTEDFINLFNDTIFIPGGATLGVFPVDFFNTHVQKLRDVAISYLNKFRPNDHSKIGRLGAAYCVERLSSHLLKKELVERYGTAPNQIYGQLTMVVGDGCDYINGSSSRNYV